MKARKKITIQDVINDSRLLSHNDKLFLKKQLDEYEERCYQDALARARAESDKVVAEQVRKIDKSLTAMSCFCLYNEFGFGKERLKKYCRAFNKDLLEFAEFLEGTGENIADTMQRELLEHGFDVEEFID